MILRCFSWYMQFSIPHKYRNGSQATRHNAERAFNLSFLSFMCAIQLGSHIYVFDRLKNLTFINIFFRLDADGVCLQLQFTKYSLFQMKIDNRLINKMNNRQYQQYLRRLPLAEPFKICRICIQETRNLISSEDAEWPEIQSIYEKITNLKVNYTSPST